MRESTLKYYTNSRGIYNTTHFAAWAIAMRLQAKGWHNLRYGFLPPKIEGISIQPDDAEAVADNPDLFTSADFAAGGAFHETLLNHYIKLVPFGAREPVMINAGYLLNHFILSDSLGYKEYKRLISTSA